MNKIIQWTIGPSIDHFFPPEEYERIVPRTVVPTDATHPFHLKISLSLSLSPFSPGSTLIRSRYPSLLPRNFLGERQKTNMEYRLPPLDIRLWAEGSRSSPHGFAHLLPQWIVYDSRVEVRSGFFNIGTSLKDREGDIGDPFAILSTSSRYIHMHIVYNQFQWSKLVITTVPVCFARHNLRFPENVYRIQGPLRANRRLPNDYTSLSIMSDPSAFFPFLFSLLDLYLASNKFRGIRFILRAEDEWRC